jgi:hypothetical protein
MPLTTPKSRSLNAIQAAVVGAAADDDDAKWPCTIGLIIVWPSLTRALVFLRHAHP